MAIVEEMATTRETAIMEEMAIVRAIMEEMAKVRNNL